MEQTPYDVIDVASAEGLWIGVGRKFGVYARTALICRSNGLEHLNYRRMVDDHHAGLTRKGWTRRIWYPLTRLSQVQIAARLADKLILLNEVDRQYAVEQGWKDAADIDVVPHGVSERYLLQDAGPGVMARGQGLLFCGSWDHAKGIAYVTAAFEHLRARGRDVRLTVLGAGVPDEVVLASFSVAARPFVTAIARLPEDAVIDLYRRHDVLLWTPTYEGFGLVLLEAMSQRMAVVATPIGCAPSLVRDGENGLVVPVRRPEATADAVERLLDDAALRQRLGDAARAAVEGMTWRATALKTLDVYARAMGGLK
jgi:glycosyltransferase involved in cell wall biosynthesis